MNDQVDIKVTLRRGRKVLAVISDAEMARRMLSETHPEMASLFARIAELNEQQELASEQ